MNKLKIAIIGGGAAGLFAGANSGTEMDVTIFEKNKFTGKKLLITGKGRCNVTTSCDSEAFFRNIPVNSRFMYSSFNSFNNIDTMDFFEKLGVELKVERGDRVFPVSDKASDIRDALYRKCLENGVRFVYQEVKSLKKTDDVFLLSTSVGDFEFDRVVIATGGVSYPLTGSTGDGYKFSADFNHTVVPPKPSLVPLVCREKHCRALMGLSLKNTALTITDPDGKAVYKDFGEMLFTHYGISGPMVLSASSHLRNIGEMQYTAHLDLKPALDKEALDKRILSDFSENKNRDFHNSLTRLLPSKLIDTVVLLTGIPPRKKVNEITKAERQTLVELLKDFTLTITATRPISEAIITSGGIATSEVNPKTMESKLVRGLYFIGEVLDVDAYTGGFNLQIAFSTAFAAIENLKG